MENQKWKEKKDSRLRESCVCLVTRRHTKIPTTLDHAAHCRNNTQKGKRKEALGGKARIPIRMSHTLTRLPLDETDRRLELLSCINS